MLWDWNWTPEDARELSAEISEQVACIHSEPMCDLCLESIRESQYTIIDIPEKCWPKSHE